MKTLSKEKLEQFHKDGYLIYRGLFSKAEMEKLYAVALRGPNNQREYLCHGR